MIYRLLIAVFLFNSLSLAQDVPFIKAYNEGVAIGNKYIENDIDLSGDGLRKSQIINKLSGNKYQVQDDIFALKLIFSGLGPAPKKVQNGENGVLLTANDFRYLGYEQRNLPNGAKQLVLNFNYSWENTNLFVSVYYEISSEEFSFRKWIGISDSSYGLQFLDRLYVESIKFDRAEFSHGQFGQPVFFNDIFLGLEYPTAENVISGSELRIGYVVGKTVVHNQYLTHKAIIGCSLSKATLESTFMKYIKTIEPNEVRPYLLYNSWYDLRNPAIAGNDSIGIMNEANVLRTITSFKKELYDKYQISLDAFVLDDGWDKYESFWGIDSSRFPEGFNSIVDSLKSIKTKLGLWASPFGGYSNRDLRVNWGSKHGFETTGNFYCLAGTKYDSSFRNIMTHYAQEYQIGYFKWDGFLLACNESNHGHLPGIYSREASVEAYINSMKSVRAVNPGIYLNITSGTWLSPWWLKYANCIWMQGEDYGYQENIPSVTERDKAITYKDVILWNNFQKQHLLFPMANLMTHGIIKGRFNMLGGANESYQSFANEVMMYFGRGVSMWELYITPDKLSADEWKSIASAVKWARKNEDVLNTTRMILGNPEKRQPYGYLHVNDNKAIFLLRNPYVEKKDVSVKVDSRFNGLESGVKYYVKVIYPYNLVLPNPVTYGDVIKISLDGYEVLAAEMVPSYKLDPHLPLGIKYSADRNGRIILWGKYGTKRIVRLVNGQNLGEIKFARSVSALKYRERTEFPEHQKKIETRLDIEIPKNYKSSRLAVLIELDSSLSHQLRPEFRATLNGKQETVSVETGNGRWYWGVVKIDSANNSINLVVDCKEKIKGRISLWLFAQEELSPVSLDNVNVTTDELLPSKPYPPDVETKFALMSSYILK
ncbi:MAG: hypothetical protein ACP5MI_08095 [Candidatus Kryptoniota bacterium]